MAAVKRSPNGVPALVTRVFESIGLLNKGSAAATTSSAADTGSPIDSTALNVTRVGGLATLIAGAGAAALALFKIDKDESATIVAAAYASTGGIVAAALIAAAIIIAADVRARALATAAAPRAESASGPNAASANSPVGVRQQWGKALARLQGVRDGLPAGAGTRTDYARLWMKAMASTGFSKDLTPTAALLDEHASLSAGQDRICALLEGLMQDRKETSAIK